MAADVHKEKEEQTVANIRKGAQTERYGHSAGIQRHSPLMCVEVWGSSSGSFCKNRNRSALKLSRAWGAFSPMLFIYTAEGNRDFTKDTHS